MITELAPPRQAPAVGTTYQPLDDLIAEDVADHHTPHEIETILARVQARAAPPSATVLDYVVAADWRAILEAKMVAS